MKEIKSNHLLPSLRVSDDAPSNAHVLEHVCRGLSCVSTVASGPAVLCGNLFVTHVAMTMSFGNKRATQSTPNEHRTYHMI